ncbi:MAG: hypothetical protein OEY55_07725 [Acidimicrobiia bacterium]|nr:hypothetical protein [Acidimicrobiia bacterium]MDH5504562.1 hypothetical protein [Acidimicrobiia bacterium]
MRRVLMVAMGLVLSACASSQHGPWVDGNDRIANGVNEYPSQFICDEKGVTFLEFGDHRFASDPLGLLGPLTNDSGEELRFGPAELPLEKLYSSGITHSYGLPGEDPNVREIYVDLETDLDYVYVAINDDRVEQWPRADLGCPTDPDLAK